MSTLSPEDFSELAEALEDACRERIEAGWQIGDAELGEPAHCCPFGALMNSTHPFAETITDELGIPLSVSVAFTNGFDGLSRSAFTVIGCRDIWIDPAAYELGRLFREKYLEGR